MFAMVTVSPAHTLVHFNRQAQATGPRRSKRTRGKEGAAIGSGKEDSRVPAPKKSRRRTRKTPSVNYKEGDSDDSETESDEEESSGAESDYEDARAEKKRSKVSLLQSSLRLISFGCSLITMPCPRKQSKPKAATRKRPATSDESEAESDAESDCEDASTEKGTAKKVSLFL